MKTMNAIVQPAYGSAEVLRFEEVERPALGDGEVLVRVHAASVCKGDVHLLTGTPYLLRLMFGLRRPKRRIAGQDVAGTVEAVGAHVTALKPGDEVYGQVPGGAFAEYVCAPVDLFAPKPANVTFEQAASVPISGLTALQGLRDAGQLKPGQKVLINGASGGVGTFAVQIAKALGAEVTAVCSTRHVDKVRSLGADRVVDYTREDFARGSERYDVMLDLVGNRALADCRAVLAPKGVFVSSAGSPGGNWIGPIVWMLKVMVAGMAGSQKMTSLMAMPRRDDLLFLRSLIEAGKVTPVIEHRFALSETAAAMRHVAEGHAQGKTVVFV
ncbi:NAD(P)-dependent alcohol dehydrogenase [Archangium gephyra]|uniref:NAD(P)-dependent alcohol dehydrogenase n=1 Tax=Archangium gephyra TaxID=48 RepID=UPI003B82547E